VLFPPPSTSQTTPCSRPTEPKSVGVRVCFDAHRLMQRSSRQPAGECTRSITASATRSRSVCGRPWATRSYHVYTRFVALVTNPSTNHLQTVCTMMHSVFYGLAPVYISNIVISVILHICRAVLMHLRSAKNGDNNTPEVQVYFLVLVSVRSR